MKAKLLQTRSLADCSDKVNVYLTAKGGIEYRLQSDISQEFTGDVSALIDCADCACVDTEVDLDLSANAVARGYYGYDYLTFAEPNLAGIESPGLTIPVPAANPGEILILAAAGGEQMTFIDTQASPYGSFAMSDAADPGVLSSPLALFDCDSTAFYHHQAWAFEVQSNMATNVTISAPDSLVNANGTDEAGVLNWHWIRLADATGIALDNSVFDLGMLTETKSNLPRVNGTPQTLETFPQDAECPQLILAAQRHNKTNQVGNVQEIEDSSWATFSGDAIELYDTSSCDSGPFDPCCMGMASAFLPAGTGTSDFDFIHNIDGAAGRQWAVVTSIPLNCTTIVCI